MQVKLVSYPWSIYTVSKSWIRNYIVSCDFFADFPHVTNLAEDPHKVLLIQGSQARDPVSFT